MPRFELPQEHLTVAIEGLQELAARLRTEYARLDCREAVTLAEERLEQAEIAQRSADFFGRL